MTNLSTLFIAVMALVGPPPADTPAQLQLKPGDTIVAIGDSITEQGGYVRDIDAVLAQQYPELKIPKVINKGVSGEKAEDLIKRFDRNVLRLKPTFVTINVGINDVWHRLAKPHDEKVLATYRKNVAKMVDEAQAAGIKVILLAPTVIEENAASEGNKRLAAYVEGQKQIAAEKKCQFVDLHAMFLAALKHKPAGQKTRLTTDGVHMMPPGDAIMAIGVLRALACPTPRLSSANRRSRLPMVDVRPSASVPRTLQCVVVTPERTVYDEAAEYVAMTLLDGEIGIAPGHTPMIGLLAGGELRIRTGPRTNRFYVHGGFVEVLGNVVSVLTEEAVRAAEIDEAVVREQIASAQTSAAATPEAAAARRHAIASGRAKLRLSQRGDA